MGLRFTALAGDSERSKVIPGSTKDETVRVSNPVPREVDQFLKHKRVTKEKSSMHSGGWIRSSRVRLSTE